MRLSSAQLSMIVYWCIGALALVVIGIGPPMLGMGIFLLGYVFFRRPHVNENESVQSFTKARPYIAYGLAGLTALSAVGVFIAAMRNHPPIEESDLDFFITYHAWIPAAAMVALVAAHEIWLFPRLKESSQAE